MCMGSAGLVTFEWGLFCRAKARLRRQRLVASHLPKLAVLKFAFLQHILQDFSSSVLRILVRVYRSSCTCVFSLPSSIYRKKRDCQQLHSAFDMAENEREWGETFMLKSLPTSAIAEDPDEPIQSSKNRDISDERILARFGKRQQLRV